jgi:hypothetical protein
VPFVSVDADPSLHLRSCASLAATSLCSRWRWC